MSDAERLARWRAWLDKDSMPSDRDRNLWDEFFGLLHRRTMWRGYRSAVDASPEHAQQSARFLTRWVLRNHIETQAIAIRRIAKRTKDPRPASLVRILDEIADTPDVISADPEKARADADALDATAEKISRFASRVVAHLDDDHAEASRDVTLADMDEAVDVIAQIFERWYLPVTGKGVAILDPTPDWWHVVRLSRRDPTLDNPAQLGARVIHELGVPAGRELLEVLRRSPEERAQLIGRLWVRDGATTLAELLIEIEADPDDLIRLRLVDALSQALPPDDSAEEGV